MSSRAKHIPEGFHTATPYLIIKDAAGAIEFYKRAFGAVELERIADPNGKVKHGEIKIGDSPFMITDESEDFPEWLSPQSRGGTPVHFYLYVEDCDALFNQAIAAGAKELLPMKDQFYGDRSGGLTDPYGHVWYIATQLGIGCGIMPSSQSALNGSLLIPRACSGNLSFSSTNTQTSNFVEASGIWLMNGT